jgi:hypothetical protein
MWTIRRYDTPDEFRPPDEARTLQLGILVGVLIVVVAAISHGLAVVAGLYVGRFVWVF